MSGVVVQFPTASQPQKKPEPTYLEMVKICNEMDVVYVRALLQMCYAKIKERQPGLLRDREATKQAVRKMMASNVRALWIFSETELEALLEHQ